MLGAPPPARALETSRGCRHRWCYGWVEFTISTVAIVRFSHGRHHSTTSIVLAGILTVAAFQNAIGKPLVRCIEHRGLHPASPGAALFAIRLAHDQPHFEFQNSKIVVRTRCGALQVGRLCHVATVARGLKAVHMQMR